MRLIKTSQRPAQIHGVEKRPHFLMAEGAKSLSGFVVYKLSTGLFMYNVPRVTYGSVARYTPVLMCLMTGSLCVLIAFI